MDETKPSVAEKDLINEDNPLFHGFDLYGSVSLVALQQFKGKRYYETVTYCAICIYAGYGQNQDEHIFFERLLAQAWNNLSSKQKKDAADYYRTETKGGDIRSPQQNH